VDIHDRSSPLTEFRTLAACYSRADQRMKVPTITPAKKIPVRTANTNAISAAYGRKISSPSPYESDSLIIRGVAAGRGGDDEPARLLRR
jgi:hypothetical protein